MVVGHRGIKPSERAMKLCKKNKTSHRVVLLDHVVKAMYLNATPAAAQPFLA